jgi:hypothetical protein
MGANTGNVRTGAGTCNTTQLGERAGSGKAGPLIGGVGYTNSVNIHYGACAVIAADNVSLFGFRQRSQHEFVEG